MNEADQVIQAIVVGTNESASIDPQWAELVGIYKRAAQIRERIGQDAAAMSEPHAAALIWLYGQLNQVAAKIVIVLMTEVQDRDPRLFAAWLEASKQKEP